MVQNSSDTIVEYSRNLNTQIHTKTRHEFCEPEYKIHVPLSPQIQIPNFSSLRHPHKATVFLHHHKKATKTSTFPPCILRLSQSLQCLPKKIPKGKEESEEKPAFNFFIFVIFMTQSLREINLEHS